VLFWLDTVVIFLKNAAVNIDLRALFDIFKVRGFVPGLYPKIRNTQEDKSKYLIQATLWTLFKANGTEEDIETIRVIEIQRRAYLL
jgi:hypothetical protein